MEPKYRKKAIREFGEECLVCGTGENIVVHHINGDRSDNSLENLTPMCRECHGKVHGRRDEVSTLVQKLGYRPRGGEFKQIIVSEELADELFDRKRRGESYEDVIWRLIELADSVED